MITIRNLINKIKWDKRETPEDYALTYWDSMAKKYIEFPYKAIKETNKNFLVAEINNEEKEIPLHRIKIVKKKGEIAWKR